MGEVKRSFHRNTDHWHIAHTVNATDTDLIGYQIGGPASFLIFADEVDGLMTLLAGIKVDDAIQDIAPHTRIYPDITDTPDPIEEAQ